MLFFFSSSCAHRVLLSFPTRRSSDLGDGGDGPVSNFLQDFALAIGPGQPLNVLLFSALIVFFCFFYTALMFNPKEVARSEEHTSELQSRPHLVCRLLLEKKKKKKNIS